MSRVQDFYPLSPMQEGMLFHTLYAPESGVYVTQVSVALPGEVDVAAFERSWRLVVARHPALRTFFVWQGLESPVQVVEREVELPIDHQDWTDLTAAACRERLAAFLKVERTRGFDLAQAPLMRLAAVRLPAGLCQVVWIFHHLILDGWSVSLVLREVTAAYEALSRGGKPNLPAVRPYRDYIVWLQHQDLALAEEHWRGMLRGFTAPTPLPVDPEARRGAAARQGYGGQRLRLSSAATAVLAAGARAAGLTVNTLIQGAWALLLGRYSGRADVAFGAAVLGRSTDLPGSDAMVGLFINTLVARVDAPADAVVAPWLQRLQVSWARSRRYEHSPLVQVQGWSEVPRGVPLFESVVSVAGLPSASGAPVRAAAAPTGARGWEAETTDQTNVPLNLEVALAAELALEVRYDLARFGDGFIQRLLGHFVTLLEALLGDPEQRLSDLPLLTAAEREQLLVAWNDTAVPLPSGDCAHRLFESWAARAPDAPALGYGEEELTYGQLDRRANGIAAALVRRGIGADDVVALLGRRGPDLAAAIFGVWKAGGAYLPLDPRDPAERLLRILEQGAPALAIVAGELEPVFRRALAALPSNRQVPVLRFTEAAAAGERDDAPPLRSGPRNLAYVIYTSGSTGLPKGAMVEHRGMLNHLAAKVRSLSLGSADCVAQTAAATFDISVWQLVAPLIAGARVRIVGDETAADPLRLLAEVERCGVTVLETVPTTLGAILERLEAALRWPALPALAWHLVTGEALPPEACRRWLRLYPRVPLLNAYGPTECSDDVTHQVIATAPDPLAQVPIGHALDNTRLYVLDPALQPLPIGIPGELYVGGLGVGRGYQADAARTAECFLPDPFSGEPGGRLYRTGDLVHRLPDGALEFLGRIGQQVKVRGFRIEVGEIEAALGSHPRVRAAVVLAREDMPGDKRLAAYVVPAASAAELHSDELRTHLAQRLPDYMLPSAWVLLDALPLTANGKLDRKALPAPVASSAPGRPEPAPPRDELEAGLVEIWEEVLATRPIGIQDNFFALGGHSLLAVRLMGMIQKRFGEELPLALLIEAGTVEQLAAALRSTAPAPPAWSPLVALQPVGDRPPFFCIHPIGGQVLCYADLSRHLGADQRFYGLQAPRLDEVGETAPAIEEMAAGYLEAVREVQPKGPYLLGGWSMGGVLAFEMARQLRARGEKAALVAILDAWSPAIHRIVPDDAYLLYEIVKDQSLQKGLAPPVSYEELRALAPEQCLRRVLEEGRRAGLVAEDVGISWLRRFLQGYRARREALQRYSPPPCPGRLTLFRAAEEDAGFLRTLETELGIDVRDPTLGWGAFATEPVVVQLVDGNHSTMCTGANARTLAGRLRAAITGSIRDLTIAPEARAAGPWQPSLHDASMT